MACCDYCGHALVLTRVGMFPRHHPYGSIACEGSDKDPRTASKKEEPVSLDLDCMCKKNDPNCTECWIVPKLVPFPDDFDRDVRYRFDECLELLLRKHKDYSGRNIAQSPGGALNGLRVRMHDKMARINNLIDTGASPEYEPLRDSFVDLANYSVIALMVLDSVWPSE